LEKILWDILSGTPLGPVYVASCDRGLLAIQIGDVEAKFLQNLVSLHGGALIRSEDQLIPIMQQISTYLEGKRKTFDVPIYWEMMSAFQQEALRVVSTIPYGETRSYGQIAAQLGRPQASRAVGRANASNPLPLVIPCHRVIGADGSLRGYGAGEGLKTKAWLLAMEHSEA
jgi:O-6-methylguanine DNA methyltransferase